MKRAVWCLLPLAVIMVLWWRLPSHQNRHDPDPPVPRASPTPSPPPSRAVPIGDQLLLNYAQPEQTPERDLTEMTQLMDNFLLLAKEAARRPLSANEDWARALRGGDGARERFLSAHNAAFNERGQLVDRWGTPLFFHAVGQGRYEVRSAGPDRAMWTDDDLHRNSDGTFRHGAALNPPSLVDRPALQP